MSTPMERLLIAAFRKLAPRDRTRLLRRAKDMAQAGRQTAARKGGQPPKTPVPQGVQ